MRIITTFAEIKAGNKLGIRLAQILTTLGMPPKNSTLQNPSVEEYRQMAELMPGVVKVDDTQQCIVISMDPQVIVGVIERTSAFVEANNGLIVSVGGLLKAIAVSYKSMMADIKKIIG